MESALRLVEELVSRRRWLLDEIKKFDKFEEKYGMDSRDS